MHTFLRALDADCVERRHEDLHIFASSQLHRCKWTSDCKIRVYREVWRGFFIPVARRRGVNREGSRPGGDPRPLRCTDFWSGRNQKDFRASLARRSVLPYRVINLHSETLTRVLECPFGQQRQAISTAVPVLHCKPSYAGRYALQKGFRWCCCRRQLIVSISNRAEHYYLQTWIYSEFAILCNASYEAVSNNGTARNSTTPNNHASITFPSFSFFLFSFFFPFSFFLFSFFFLFFTL